MKVKRYKWFLFAIIVVLVISFVSDLSLYRKNTYIDLKSGKKMIRKYIVGAVISESFLDTTFSQKVSKLGLVDKNIDEHLWHLDNSYVFSSSTSSKRIHSSKSYEEVIASLIATIELANLDLSQQKQVLHKALIALKNKNIMLLIELTKEIDTYNSSS